MTTYTVTYRDTYNREHTFTVSASSLDSATDMAVEWKGSAPVSIVSVEAVEGDDEPHQDDEPDYVEFPHGEFRGQADLRAVATKARNSWLDYNEDLLA